MQRRPRPLELRLARRRRCPRRRRPRASPSTSATKRRPPGVRVSSCASSSAVSAISGATSYDSAARRADRRSPATRIERSDAGLTRPRGRTVAHAAPPVEGGLFPTAGECWNLCKPDVGRDAIRSATAPPRRRRRHPPLVAAQPALAADPACAAAGGAASGLDARVAPRRPRRSVPGELVVRYRDGAAAERRHPAPGRGRRPRPPRRPRASPSCACRSGTALRAATAALRRDRDVLWAEPNYLYRAERHAERRALLASSGR